MTESKPCMSIMYFRSVWRERSMCGGIVDRRQLCGKALTGPATYETVAEKHCSRHG